MAVLERSIASPTGLAVGEAEAGTPARLRWRWTGDEMIRMGEVGLLPAQGRFELLDGVIYQIMPPGPLHAFIVDIIGGLLERLAQERGAHVREEKPIRLSEHYDPQPDIAVIRGPERAYRRRFPGPGEVLLAVEVADSSVEDDQREKIPAYAAAGIPESWLVNLRDQQVEVYREPRDGIYRSIRIHRPGDVIEPALLPGVTIPVADLLGQEETPEPIQICDPPGGHG